MSDVAHLGHVETYADTFEASLDCFGDEGSLTLAGQAAAPACLRPIVSRWHNLGRG